MLVCPSCAGELRFDIASQQMKCGSCGSLTDPFNYDPQKVDGRQDNVFDATIYTCPQCGGEVFTTDDTIASFCSFCGASTVLSSRIQQAHRPQYLIPFQITKEKCKEEYASVMKKAIFAPKELRSPRYIESFRGIYMPYWTYYIRQDGQFVLPGRKEYRKGNYIYKETYELTGEIDAYYKGISFDASSSFDDNISEALAPYDVKGMKGFTPAYLAGFYADTADLDENVYKQEAVDIACNASVNNFKKDSAFHGIDVQTDARSLPSRVGTRVEASDYSMFPVWFMAYRNHDRVAYATVNGQTGKVVADIPISPKKFALGSLLVAIVFFLILCIGFTPMPSESITAVAVLALITLIVYSRELTLIGRRETRETDIGYNVKNHPENVVAAEQANYKELTKSKDNKKLPKTNSKMFILAIIAFELIITVLPVLTNGIHSSQGGGFGKFIIWGGISIASIIICVMAYRKFDKIPGKQGRAGITTALLSILLATAITAFNPFYDWIYYLGVMVMLLGIFVTLLDILKAYNLLSTRRLPQFDHKGGDDRA